MKDFSVLFYNIQQPFFSASGDKFPIQIDLNHPLWQTFLERVYRQLNFLECFSHHRLIFITLLLGKADLQSGNKQISFQSINVYSLVGGIANSEVPNKRATRLTIWAK